MIGRRGGVLKGDRNEVGLRCGQADSRFGTGVLNGSPTPRQRLYAYSCREWGGTRLAGRAGDDWGKQDEEKMVEAGGKEDVGRI